MTFLFLLLVVAAGIVIKWLVKISDQLNAASPTTPALHRHHLKDITSS